MYVGLAHTYVTTRDCVIGKSYVNRDVSARARACVCACVCVRVRAVVGIRKGYCAENTYASVDLESLRKNIMSQNSWF